MKNTKLTDIIAAVPEPARDPDSSEWIRASKAAQLLDLHVATLHRWRLQGKLRAWRLGGTWRFLRVEIDALLQEGRPAPQIPSKRHLTRAEEAQRAWSSKILREAGI